MTKRIAAILMAMALLMGCGVLSAAAGELNPSQQLPIDSPSVTPPPHQKPGIPVELPGAETEPAEETEATESTEETEAAEDAETEDETQAAEETIPTEEMQPAALAETEPSETETAQTVETEAETEETELMETVEETLETTQETGEVTGEQTDEEEDPEPPLVLYIGGAVAVLVILVLAVLMRRNKDVPPVTTAGEGVPLHMEVLAGKGKPSQKVFYLNQELFIGSDPACDMVWKDPSVAPRHCRIFIQNDLIYLEDLNDRSTTFVEGLKIYAPNRLRSEDVITIGEVQFKLLF